MIWLQRSTQILKFCAILRQLERAFISVVTKNVELIREHLQAGEGAKEFRAWIRNNATNLMPSHFEHIIEERAINENRKAIVNAIKVMQNKLDF